MVGTSPPSKAVGTLPVNVWLIGQESATVQPGDRYSVKSVDEHPGKMRPALARLLIETYTKLGETVLDPLARIIHEERERDAERNGQARS